jgi:signal transduction histidine kinase/CheY-like chemotaxis protein
MSDNNFLAQLEENLNNLQLPINADIKENFIQLLSDFQQQIDNQISNFISKLTIPAISINRNGIILKVNPKWEDTFGFKSEDTIHLPLTNYIPNSQKESFSGIMSDIALNKEISEREIKILKKDGIAAPTGFCAFKLLPDSDETIILLRDLGIVKKLEKELTKSRVKLQKSEQFKSVFLANMSHEIRTPMNAIIGFSELINIEGISPEKRKDYSRIINQRGQQLLTLIDDIIETTKIEAGRITLDYTWIELDEFMNDIFSTVLQKKIKEGKDNIELILQKQETKDHFQFYTDPGRLHQIFLNLVFYTLKNTTKGSVIFGYHICDDKQIEFYIQDTGAVLNTEEQRLLFEHFWKIEDSTHIKIKGAGLGLTISKSLIELFGGKINVVSDPQKGTTFIFKLPIIIPNDLSDTSSDNYLFEEHRIGTIDPNWKNKVILVVEDDIVNYQFIEALLEKTQVQLLHAENGFQALELCKTINKIDLILMDIKLPEKNGYEITKEIKSFRKDIPIIAQTAFAMNEVKERCFESGCSDIITKPVDIELFMSKLNKYLS